MKKIEERRDLRVNFVKIRELFWKTILKGGNDVIPVAVQDASTKEVLIIAYANEEALRYSLEHGVATFWSTSRNELWIKGATSESVLELVEVRVNCEQNSLLYLVHPVNDKGACHTREADGKYRRTCFYRKIKNIGKELFLEML